MSLTTVSITTPLSKHDPALVALEEIPLPPEALWQELDNSDKPVARTTAGGTSEGASTGPVMPEPAAADIAGLDFVSTAHSRVIDLKHPFLLDGKVVSAITVRRLKIGEVDGFIRASGHSKASLSTFDIYALMTGFPAAVLRGLIDKDGDAVVDAAYDFLPRILKQDGSAES